ncbi:MAG TPA: SDR family oxidoreductase [Bacteroidota bacterium]|nr:SDR family oxidoreductase [Bacteroidota bacterium]
MNTGLQGKVVLITGAGRGIGKSIAFAMAAEGARLAICARDEQQLQLTADEIQAQAKADVIAVKANVTRLNDIRRFVDAAARKFNRIDILVNNAGAAHTGGILTTTDEEWEYNIQLKLLGYIRMTREVIPHMKTSGGGKIINIAGMTANEPSPYSLVPGVTDAAILAFTKSVSRELEKDRILVNSVNPTTTDTPLAENNFKQLALVLQKTPEEVRRSLIASMPQGRLATADDIAGVVVFLASEAANFINGISINVDAGQSPGVW